MSLKTGKYSRYQLFHAISRDNDPTTVNVLYFTHHKVEATQVLNGLPCIISEELLVNLNDLITRQEIERVNMGIWDKDKCTFTNPNKLHNKEVMEGMFEGTSLTALDLY